MGDDRQERYRAREAAERAASDRAHGEAARTAARPASGTPAGPAPVSEDLQWYWLERARKALEAALQSTNQEIAATHRDLSDRHMRQATQIGSGRVVLTVVPRQEM